MNCSTPTKNEKNAFFQTPDKNKSYSNTPKELKIPIFMSPENKWKSPFLKKTCHTDTIHQSKTISSPGDRFIPFRTTEKQKISFNLHSTDSDNQNQYNNFLQQKLLTLNSCRQVLQFKNSLSEQNDVISKQLFGTEKKQKYLESYKVLDAPGLIDDFYIDILDWSNQNFISVCLNSVFVYEANKQIVTPVINEVMTSLKFNKYGNILLMGNDKGEITQFNMEKQTLGQSLEIADKRIGCISFSNNYVFATGSRDKAISIGDLRVKNLIVQNYQNSHQSEVCGLEFSQDENYLASGGNDNKAIIWSLKMGLIPVWKISEHKAAVRALSWKNNNFLATGGGNDDQTIRVWNIFNKTNVQTVNVQSQVCKLLFSPNSDQLLSTHGYQKNELILWDCQNLQEEIKQIQVYEGHASRVLYIGLSPDQSTLVTGAGDETLKFWKVFPQKQVNKHSMLNPLTDLR